ncbi:MAG: ribonuclease III [Spirochaetales bacterium]|nr:ribonuclease III [Spirochaetales bacterium]
MSFFKKLAEKDSLIDEIRLKELKHFSKSLGIRFRRLDLLDLALTHRSYLNINKNNYNNERLEFLGDSVLGVVVTEYLYKSFPEKKEGELAKIKSYVVSEEVLAKIGLTIGIDSVILFGKGEEASGGRKKNAIIEDAVEALFGAYYLDQGYDKIKKFIRSLLIPEIDLVLKGDYRKDYKTILQELAQKKDKVCPKYVLVEKMGPDHNITFKYEVLIHNNVMGTGIGRSKKSAEQKAAKDALISYK